MFEIVTVDFLVILLIVSIFTIIQSLFGIGILVFGTPTLLLLGYEFTDVLSYLFFSSIAVSFCQVYPNQKYIVRYKFSVLLYLLPMVAIGLLVVIYFAEFNLMLLVGLILFFTFITRFSTYLTSYLNNLLSTNFRFGLMITGFIHGLSNLGGAPLLAITNGMYDNKKEIQVNIAYAYFTMAIIQLAILVVTNLFMFDLYAFILPLFSIIIYWFFGNKIFVWATEKFYYNTLTIFILCYSLLLIFKSVYYI